MNKTRIIANSLFAILCAALINSKSFAKEPPNIDHIRQAVVAYHDSGAYDRELNQAILAAEHYITQRANTTQNTKQNLAIVLDIDETTLSNYEKMLARHFIFDAERGHAENLAADSLLIQPMLKLYHTALQHNIAVFFVSGRPLSEQAATEKNLKNTGFTEWQGLFLRPNNYKIKSIVPHKLAARKQISEKGYTIIASIGDQDSDLAGGYAEKTFKLPNPYYYIP